MNPIDTPIGNDLRATRLGTCFDNNKRKLLVTQNSFDLAKLNSEKLLLFIDGIAKFELTTNSNNNSAYNSSAFNISAKAEGGAFGCKVAMGFNMSSSRADAQKSKSIKACLSYRYMNQAMQIQKATEKTYFNCLLTDCQTALNEIFQAKSPDDKLRKYREFTKTYGHACVTKLYLGAGSIANIEIDANESAVSNSSKYGVNAAVSSAFVSASTAVNWAEEHKKAGLKGSLKIDAIDYPQNSPTKEWAHALITSYAGKGLDVLTEGPGFADLPRPNFESTPPYPKLKKPDNKELPKNDSDLSNETQKEIMKDENFEGSWEDFVKRQKQELEKIDKSKIVKDAKNIKRNNVEIKQQPQADKSVIREAQLDANIESDWDLGGYLPVGYELTPWTDLFPSLKATTKYPSTSNIIFAKIMTFYYTRLQFGQYMNFLLDVGEAYNNADNKIFLANDIKSYFNLCEKYLEEF